MKTKQIQNLDNFTGTILIPVFETNVKSIVPIEYHGISVPSKVFYGKKDTHYLVEKYDCTHVFIGLGKEIDYKALKTIFRRISAKQKDVFGINVALVIPDEFKNDQVEATVSGLLLGTYDLGHYKKEKTTHPLNSEEFIFEIVSSKDFSEVVERAVKIANAPCHMTFKL